MNRRSFLKGAASLCALGVQSACQQDYELHNYPSMNLDGMRPPDCLGEINLLFLHHDFEEGPIPEEFFMNTYRDYGIEVKKDTGSMQGYDNDPDIDHAVRVMFRNVPFDSPSWERFGLRAWVLSRNPYRMDQLLRDFAFYFPVKNSLVYANQSHFHFEVNNIGTPGAWHNSTTKWDLTYPIGIDKEDSVCEEEYNKFISGPLQNPEKEL